jgi:two-component system response regulator DesR
MDISMPNLDGIAATSQVRAELPFVRVLGLSTLERMDDLHAIERAGAEGFFTKDDGICRLLDHLLAIDAGREAPGPEAGPARRSERGARPP